MAHDRDVAGIRCSEVLARLSDFLDDDLQSQVRAQIEDHLRGCDWCEKFGGEFAETIQSLRRGLLEAEPVESDVLERLRAKLDAEV